MLERVWRKGITLTLLVGMQTDTATMEYGMIYSFYYLFNPVLNLALDYAWETSFMYLWQTLVWFIPLLYKFLNKFPVISMSFTPTFPVTRVFKLWGSQKSIKCELPYLSWPPSPLSFVRIYNSLLFCKDI